MPPEGGGTGVPGAGVAGAGFAGGSGTPKGVGSPDKAQPGEKDAATRRLAPRAAAVTYGLREPGIRAEGLLQREPVIRDLQFHLLRGGWQLVGAKEHDPACNDQDKDTEEAEEWLAHV
jgi:hypothetical protein